MSPGGENNANREPLLSGLKLAIVNIAVVDLAKDPGASPANIDLLATPQANLKSEIIQSEI
jgi:hypothetical protein